MPIEDDLLAPDEVHRKYNKTIQPLTISLNDDYNGRLFVSSPTVSYSLSLKITLKLNKFESLLQQVPVYRMIFRDKACCPVKVMQQFYLG